MAQKSTGGSTRNPLAGLTGLLIALACSLVILDGAAQIVAVSVFALGALFSARSLARAARR
ncbi:hypothetical protein [Streptomyces nitrosporeus]|uniref:hypothetical protein n=1 Tax=Streptomyces nitrosporeus TaxID=28894 RepID=UPI00123C831D|nr:hypothetical protein [Streptomyces nitrosporeus]GGZ11896.1 hypothetical protein GCM10010327_48290 [Streptomyces nitrosporeus]